VRPRVPHVPAAGTVESVPSESGEAELPLGVGRGGASPTRVERGRALILGVGRGGARPLVVGRGGSCPSSGLGIGPLVPFFLVGRPWPCNSLD
jgi:hypothetical protein